MSTLGQQTSQEPQAFRCRLVHELVENVRALMLVFTGVAVVLVSICGAPYAWRTLVGAGFDNFVQRISNADRAIASRKNGAVSITIAGAELKRLIQAVSLAEPDRPLPGFTDSCIFNVQITFYEGDKALGNILSCQTLFILQGSKYRVSSGVLGALAVDPADAAYDVWAREHTQSP